MIKAPWIIATTTDIGLAGCVEVTDQTMGSVTTRGQTYRTVTTEFVEKDGTRFAKTVVLVAGYREPCNPNIAGDCAEAVSYALRRTGRPSQYPRRNGEKYILPPV